MMPKDKLPTGSYGEIEAYLAEGRSIGGLSGSPVFVRNTVNMPVQTAKGKLTNISGLGGLHLLGLMHGHWDVPISFANAEEGEAVNMGVSIVIPAKKILETLYHPELVAMREEHWRKQKMGQPPVTGGAIRQPTEADCEAALKKSSRNSSDQK